MGRISILIACLLVGFTPSLFAQSSEDVAVELSAVAQVSPPRITLHWKPNGFYTPSYNIFKKAKSATSWGTSAIATLTATDSVYIDNAVIVDSGYEYEVVASSGSLVASGYMYAAIHAPAIHNRGTMVLVVDSTFTTACATEIQTLMNDLSGDGWQLIRHDFGRTAKDVTVKAAISNDYATRTDVKSVFVLGHLAVPYSGGFNSTVNPPDGHVPQHNGAWPADIYYGCMSGVWTDVSVNDLTATMSDNWNSIGDGKWDQNMIPAPAVLQVSRVDFYNMPAFTATETQLMKSYLAKDHNYKMDSLAVRHRGIISDNFGFFSGEAFAANGWRNFAPLVSKDSLTYTGSAFISSLSSASYQWGYATGGGTFTSAGGIGSTTDYTTNNVNGIFMMMFGSFFGDWNAQNNFLRAPLCAATPALTNCWAGRPNWFMHHMALGENIGYSALLSQNNTSLYVTPQTYGNTFIHVALMGDLSLRTDYIQPVRALTITAPASDGAHLSWTASADPAVIGYYIYRADTAYGYYKRLNDVMLPVATTTYHDYVGASGKKFYQVRPVKLQSTPSGGYYNLGLGSIDSANVTFGPLSVAAVAPKLEISLAPNPAQRYLSVTINATNDAEARMYMVNEIGVTFMPAAKRLTTGDNRYMLDISAIPSGVYTLVINTGDALTTKKWVKL